jgi:hypothetical protein
MSNSNALLRQSLEIQEKYLLSINIHLLSMPEGSMYQSLKGNNSYYYQCISIGGVKERKYLGTADGKQALLISDLKRKRYLLGCKKVLEENAVALRACLLKYQEFDPTLISGRLAASYQNIPEPQSASNDLDWQHAPYTRAEMYEENLKHEAIDGLKVRSKSEALIAFTLDLARVPFHYEEVLELEGKKIAPDFTILHPMTGERIYWEHFGMMDDAAYATETFRKLVIYGRNNILPGKNLIFTMETSAEPLSILEVQRTIRHYFSA